MIVRRLCHSEFMTSLGSAVAAAIAVDIDPSGLLQLREHPADTALQHIFSNRLTSDYSRQLMLSGWHAAVERSMDWVSESAPHPTIDSLDRLMTRIDKPMISAQGDARSNETAKKVLSALKIVEVSVIIDCNNV